MIAERMIIEKATGVEVVVSTGNPITQNVVSPAGSLFIDKTSPGVYLSTGASWTPLQAGAVGWASITGKPTTIAGFGITDFNSLGDGRWGQLAGANTWTQSQAISVGGLAIQLTNVTQNTIYWAAAGTNIPAVTTRSTGTKLVLYPSITGTQVDFAIGISSSAMWFSLPDNSAAEFWRFYGGVVQVATLSGTGIWTMNGLMVIGSGNSASLTVTANTTTFLDVSINAAAYRALFGMDSGGLGFVGTFSNHPFTIRQNNVAVATFAIGGALTLTSTFTVSQATSAAIVLNTTTGATSDNTGILFERGGTIKWRIGTNIGGANIDTWSLYNNTLGDAITANFATGLITAPFGLTVGSTTGVTLSSTNTQQILLGELTGANPNQLLIGVDTTTTISRIQSVHQGIAYTQLDLNPLGGLVTIGIGLTLKTNGYLTFNSGLAGTGIKMYGQSDNFIYMTGGGSTTAAGIALFLNNYTTIVGYFYGSAGFVGFLDAVGTWRVQCSSTGGTLGGNWTVSGTFSTTSSIAAAVFNGGVLNGSSLAISGTTATIAGVPIARLRSGSATTVPTDLVAGEIYLAY